MRALLFVLLLVILGGCEPAPPAPEPAPLPPPNQIGMDAAGERWASRTLERLTLEQKVAQLFAVAAPVGFGATDDPAHRAVLDQVRDLQVGGVIFFQSSPLEQASFVNQLQQAAPVPLLVSQDMEWGAGMRINGATRLPTAMAIAASQDPEVAYRAGRVTGAEARSLGVRQVFAPVADINTNPRNPVIDIRSFGDNPDLASILIASFVRGLQDEGVLATVKHFPGHGRTGRDSHRTLPVVTADFAAMDSVDLVPFRAAISAGVASVMSAHVSYPELDRTSGRPATLAAPIVQDLLRDSLSFGGLLVSDALNMAGVTGSGSTGHVAVRALEAGIDMLLMPLDVFSAHRAVMRAVRSGRITEQRIETSVLRILRAKALAGLHRSRFAPLDDVRSSVGNGRHKSFANSAAARGLTLLGSAEMPVVRPGLKAMTVTLSDRSVSGRDAVFRETLTNHSEGVTWTHREILPGVDAQTVGAVVREAARTDHVILTVMTSASAWQGRAGMSSTYRRLIDRLSALKVRTTLVVLGTPYLVADLANTPDAILLAYGDGDAEQRAAAFAVGGRSDVSGRLPVTISGAYRFGSGSDLEARLPRPARPEEAGMEGPSLARIDSLIQRAISDRAFPGAAVAVGRGDAIVHLAGYGYYTYQSEQRVTPRSLFDMASVTKVVTTTTAIMQLYEQGLIGLHDPVARYVPEFGKNGKDEVTIWHLLTHTGGLIPFRPFYAMGVRTRRDLFTAIFDEELIYEPGSESRYSDFGPIMLAELVQRVTRMGFSVYAKRFIFEPLEMWHSGFRPVGRGTITNAVPTENDTYFRYRVLQGEVHDENAWIMGGVAGHAGLFSTAEDMARFAFMLVNNGRVGNRQFLQAETIELFTTPVDPELEHTRALGWDTRSPEGYSSAGQLFGPSSYGHTGFTGTSIWIDPNADLFVIMLTNRVYPTRYNGRHRPVRPALADIAHGSIRTSRASPLLPGD